MRRQTRPAARCKKHPYNRPNRRHRQPNRKGPDHPLPMQRNFPPPDMPKCFAQREQEEDPKQRRGRGLIQPTNRRHRKTHHQCRNSNHKTATQENAPAPPMPFQMPRAYRRAELQRPQQHEKQSRYNMHERQNRVAHKCIVERSELCEPRIVLCRRRTIPMHRNRQRVCDPPHRDRTPHERQEDNPAPHRPLQSISNLHTLYYVCSTRSLSCARIFGSLRARLVVDSQVTGG
jgi:hypothetical protein